MLWGSICEEARIVPPLQHVKHLYVFDIVISNIRNNRLFSNSKSKSIGWFRKHCTGRNRFAFTLVFIGLLSFAEPTLMRFCRLDLESGLVWEVQVHILYRGLKVF